MSNIETKTKFHMSNPKVGQIFTEDQFFKWSDNNLYRTSTHDMSDKVSKPESVGFHSRSALVPPQISNFYLRCLPTRSPL